MTNNRRQIKAITSYDRTVKKIENEIENCMLMNRGALYSAEHFRCKLYNLNFSEDGLPDILYRMHEKGLCKRFLINEHCGGEEFAVYGVPGDDTGYPLKMVARFAIDYATHSAISELLKNNALGKIIRNYDENFPSELKDAISRLKDKEGLR